jgi:hypothetical protein
MTSAFVVLRESFLELRAYLVLDRDSMRASGFHQERVPWRVNRDGSLSLSSPVRLKADDVDAPLSALRSRIFSGPLP